MSRDDPVRIMICEDSRAYSHALTRFLEHDGDLRVVGVCSTAEQLFSRLRELPCDLITMDLELPGLDGVSAIEQIMHSDPQRILVVSAHTDRGSKRAAATLAAGALDAIHKADLRLDATGSPRAGAMRRRIKRLARVPLGEGAQTRSLRPGPKRGKGNGSAPVRTARVVGIASSTGGPAALTALLSQLPAGFPLPVLVVQHISAGFTEGLVRWLDEAVALPVRVASDGQRASPGVWFAPADAHLALESSFTMSLDYKTKVGPHRPSADVLLTSLARVVEDHAVGVVLTGMGRDGAHGIAAIRAAGGLTVAQDSASSVVNGMPNAARRAGAELSLPAEEIGALLGTFRAERSFS